ncbi:MAG: hypothetical protein GXY61_11720 [Lentisphaerae bacterium]|jgi:hypothetical protein|nr:hypothetical protein [Lentisphaerota bacterium]
MKIKNRHWISIAFSGCVFAGVLVFSGCVRTVIEPMYIPIVSASRGRDGIVTVSWPSRVGYRYRLFAANSHGEKEPVEKYGEIFTGTGENIEISFFTNPNEPLPVYSVMPEKMD